MTVLWTLALAGLLGSALLFAVGGTMLAHYSRRPFSTAATSIERKFVVGALAAAIFGAASLFVVPAYRVSDCSVSVSPEARLASPSYTSTVATPTQACTERSETYFQAHGSRVVPLFAIPMLLSVVPFAFFRLRCRSLALSVCAFVLAGQAAVGLSGYGLAFSPSSVLLVAAGFIGLFSHSA